MYKHIFLSRLNTLRSFWNILYIRSHATFGIFCQVDQLQQILSCQPMKCRSKELSLMLRKSMKVTAGADTLMSQGNDLISFEQCVFMTREHARSRQCCTRWELSYICLHFALLTSKVQLQEDLSTQTKGRVGLLLICKQSQIRFLIHIRNDEVLNQMPKMSLEGYRSMLWHLHQRSDAKQ